MKQKYQNLVTAAVLAVVAAACTDGQGATQVELPAPADTTKAPTTPSKSLTPASLAMAGGNGQSANLGLPVAVAPSVIVKDQDGKALPGVQVFFTVVSGGGSVQNAVATTGTDGVASAGKWTLGVVAGTNTLDASVSGLKTVRFTATATTPVLTPPTTSGSYNITIRYVGTATARQQQAVSSAVARWQSVITGELSNIPLSASANTCFTGQPAINETIDDILIYVDFGVIDGSGKVLGQAGPCFVRSDNNLPVLGQLKLDAADLALMEANGTLDDVVLHEIGHILGIGTLWTGKSLLNGAGTWDPRFVGANAVSAYHAMGGLDAYIAVENTGGTGTADGHWREAVFGNELMTGYISASANPMSSMTVASLSDIGYGTNPGAAGTFTLSRASGGLQSGGTNLHGREKFHRPKFKVDRRGKKTAIQ